MSATSLIIGLFNIAKPWLIRVGTWVLEKVIKKGAKSIAKFLARRSKALKRRAIRAAKKMVRSRRHSSPDLPQLSRSAKRVEWLLFRRKNYLALSEFLITNAEIISKNVAERIRSLAGYVQIPKKAKEETLEGYEEVNAQSS